MPQTNLDKFYTIQSMMAEVSSLKAAYIRNLQERYEYMSEYRREYKKLVRAVNDVKHMLNKEDEKQEENEVLKKAARKKLQRYIESYEEQEELNPDIDYKKRIEALNEALNALKTHVKLSTLEEIQSDLSRIRISITEIDALIELNDKKDSALHEQKQQIKRLIDMAESDYLTTFKVYRIACEHQEGVYEVFNDVFNVLAQLGYDNEAGIMADALPDLEEPRKQRPDPTQLLEVLKPIKSAKLEYWQSNRTNSHAYEYNIAFAKEVAYARRALLEDREYIGTRNAFKRLEDAYESLESYMYERYHELGGTPYNYHGHLDRL